MTDHEMQSKEDHQTTRVLIRVGSTGQLPLYATPGSAGCDLIAARDLVLLPGETSLMPLDLVIPLEPGVEAQVRPRSGLSLRTSLRLPNTPGTIDSDYRAPVGLRLDLTYSQADLPMQILRNLNLPRALAQLGRQVSLAEYLKVPGKAANLEQLPDLANQILYLDEQGNPYGTLYFKAGDRIAQMVFSRWLRAVFVHHEKPEEVGTDRGGGFGSTGI